jgi:hypothetical protein
MKLTKILVAFAMAASALTMNVNAGIFDANPEIYGMVAPANTAQRTVDITADTKKVNVTNGETITFNINGTQFTWKFDLYHQEGVLELSTILPKDLHADGVTIYVAEDPMYRELYRG